MKQISKDLQRYAELVKFVGEYLGHKETKHQVTRDLYYLVQINQFYDYIIAKQKPWYKPLIEILRDRINGPCLEVTLE